MNLNSSVRQTKWLLVVCLFFMSSDLLARQNLKQPNGYIDRLSKAPPVVRLETDSQGDLETQYDESRGDFQEFLTEMKRGVNRSSSGASSGGGSWQQTLGDGDSTMLLAFGPNKLGGRTNFPGRFDGGLVMHITQKQPKQSSVIMSAGPENKSIKVELNRENEGFLFRFEKRESGEVVCRIIDAEDIIAVSAENFASFSKAHWRVLNQKIMPLLRGCGVALPPSRFSKPVWSHLLASIRPIDATRTKEFRGMVEALSQPRFAAREKATQTLTQDFDLWQDLIGLAIDDDDVSLESRSRLQAIIDKHVSTGEKQVRKVLTGNDLLEDPGYLIWIVNQIADEPERKEDVSRLFAQLRKTTGKDFGTDLSQWNEFLKIGQDPAKVDRSVFSSSLDLASESGPLEKIKLDIRELVPLKTVDGLLRLNRGKWSEFFNHRTTDELLEDVRQKLVDNHLPTEWFRPSSIYLATTIDYPQILFMASASKIKGNVNPVNGYDRICNRSRNRFYNKRDIRADLKLHPDLPVRERNILVANGQPLNRFNVVNQGRAGKVVDVAFYSIRFQEKNENERTISFKELPDGTLTLTFSFGSTDAYVRYVQSPTADGMKCLFQDIRGDDVFAVSAGSFEDLVVQNKEYYAEQWKPIAKSFGIEMPTK